MALYELNDWENNGYHDSYFYKAVWNDSTGAVELFHNGATAYGASLNPEPPPAVPTPEILEKARLWLKDYIKSSFREAEAHDIEWPKSLQKGDRVVVKSGTRKLFKVSKGGPCIKCSGSGHWVNPRNRADKRECFACSGTGQGRGKAEALVENGKRVYQPIPAGTKGTVLWAGQHENRKVYAKGYNTLADVSQALVKFDLPFSRGSDHLEVAYFEFAQLALDQEPISAEALEEKAERLSYNFHFKPALDNHGGWLSSNLALAVWQKQQAQQ